MNTIQKVKVAICMAIEGDEGHWGEVALDLLDECVIDPDDEARIEKRFAEMGGGEIQPYRVVP